MNHVNVTPFSFLLSPFIGLFLSRTQKACDSSGRSLLSLPYNHVLKAVPLKATKKKIERKGF